MLKDINPLLTPPLLQALSAMGHGDILAVCDANFPAYALAGAKPLIHLPGSGVVPVLQAILSVMPLDTYGTLPILCMQQVEAPDALSDAQQEALDQVFSQQEPLPTMACLERFAYYERARQAYAFVLTGDQRAYGNFLLRKGVL